MIWILWFLLHSGQTNSSSSGTNARVGTGHQTWEGVIGTEGVGKCNRNNLLLLRKCVEHELLITNTVFRVPTRRWTSWMHPRSKHWHLIDYVIVRRKGRQDVRVTKTMCGADCWTDHRLVVSKLNLRIQPVRRPQSKKVPKRLDVSKLKQHSKRQVFVNDICSHLYALEHSSEDVDESWTVFRDTVHSSTMESLGPVSRKHQDCFDENDKGIQGLLEEKYQNHKAYLRNTSSVSSKTAYLNICKSVQTRLRDMQDFWLSKKANEIQSFADRKDMKKFFGALKTIHGPQSSRTTTFLSADGTSLLTDKEAILKRWIEHFDGVLNRPSSSNDAAINRLPQVECNPLLDEFPAVFETVKAIKLLSSGKAPGSDAKLQRSTKQRGSSSCRETDSYFTLCGEKKPSLKNSRMQQLSTYSKGKGILKSVTIIEASLYCQLLGRSLIESYRIDWMNILNSQGFYQKASVDSRKTDEQQTCSSQQDSFKRKARNRMWTFTWPLSTLPKHLTQSVLRDFGKLWQCLAVLPTL